MHKNDKKLKFIIGKLSKSVLDHLESERLCFTYEKKFQC